MENNEIVIKERKNIVKSFLHILFDMRDNMMSYEDIDTMMRESTVIHGANMWILMLAILIASIGLNMNSTAVIIGAMLISPLMSGIMSMGYSVAVRDIPLLLKALVRFLVQVSICLVTSVIYFTLSPLKTATAEMIARTSPTIWDVLIALFGGLAGMIGHTRTKHSNVIPGVAIATALMPPLCTAGYGIATGQTKFFIGAFYLFIINTLFIAISTAIVVLILKVPYHKSVSDKAQANVNFIILIITIAAVIPSAIVGAATVHDSYIDNSISNYLNKEFTFSNTQIVKSETDRQNKIISVSLVGDTLSPEITELLQNRLNEYNLSEYSLEITQNIFTEGTSNDKVQILLQENTIEKLNELTDSQSQQIQALQEELENYYSQEENTIDFSTLSQKAETVFTQLSNCKLGLLHGKDSETVFFSAEAEEMPDEKELNIIRNWLSSETGITDTEINISQIITEDDMYDEEWSDDNNEYYEIN